MKKLFLILCSVLMSITTFSQTLDTTWPGANGPVYSIYKHPTNNTVYIGGDFTRLGYEAPYIALVNKTTGDLAVAMPRPNDVVRCMLPDGNGGYYIGGDFTTVGGLPRKYAAQIDATGKVTAWNPNTDAKVMDIEKVGGTVYMCGLFTTVGGQARKYIAAVDAVTGAATTWNPQPADNQVNCIAISGTTLFAAGQFSTIGAASRDKLAQFDLSTAALTPFSITMTGNIEDIIPDGNTLYLGGSIFTVNGQTRTNIAALTISTATLTSLAPHMMFGYATDIELDGNILYVGGNFSFFGGLPCDGAGSVNVITGVTTAWAPGTGGGPHYITIEGNTVYLTGASANGLPVGIAGYDKNTGIPTGFVMPVDGDMYDIHIGTNGIFTVGDFHTVNYKLRTSIAALNASTGKLLSWDPYVFHSGIVYAITGAGNSIYIGGDFDYVGSQLRASLAEVDATTAALMPFKPEIKWQGGSGVVKTMAVDNNLLYIGGQFDKAGGANRLHAAAFDRTTGNTNSWNPGPDDAVNVMRINAHNVYMAGSFVSVGSNMRNYIGAVDANGNVLGWNPNPSTGFGSGVSDLRIRGNSVYVAGQFASIGGQNQPQLADLDLNTAACNVSFSPDFAGVGRVSAVEVVRDSVYLGGQFIMTDPVPVSALGAVHTSDGKGTSWDPNIAGSGTIISVLTTDTTNLYVGGTFYQANGAPRNNFAVYKLPPALSVANTTTAAAAFTLWPNPATEGKFHCKFTSLKQQLLTLTITDITGKVLHTQTVNAKQGANNMPVTFGAAGKQLLVVSLKGEGVQYAAQKLLAK